MADEREVIDEFTVDVPMDLGTEEERMRIAITRAEEISSITANGAKWKKLADRCIGPRWVLHRYRDALDEDDNGEDVVDYN